VARPRTSLTERFWSKVDRKDQGDCWPWLGWRDGDGYGQISIGGAKGRRIRATAAAWLLTYGEMPTNQVLHRCDNPSCVNASHLFLGTQADNMRDMVAKGRKYLMRGRLNRRAKLNDASVRAIRSSTLSNGVLASAFGVSPSVISEVRSRKAWGHVD
jgi:hypothetical protein